MKKNKKLIISVLFIFIISLGSYIYINSNRENYAIDMNLKNYLGVEYQNLSEKDKENLNKIVNEINNLKLNSHNLYLYDEKIEELNNEIKKTGINMPYSSYREFLEKNQKNIKDNDYNTLLDLTDEIEKETEKIDKLNQSNEVNKLYLTEEKIKNLEEQRGQILIKNNIDPYNVKEEVESLSINYEIINVVDGYLNLNKTLSNKGNIIMYEKLWGEVLKIIPDYYLNYISKFKIFTDGMDNTLAYVLSDEEIENKWTISVDLIDSLDYKGNINKELHNTLIHEFMHLITLNDTQISKKLNYFGETYTIEEGSLNKDSYLNLFYNKFWKKHKEQVDFQNRPNLTDEEKENYTSSFYFENIEEFVSEYAATNPVEDIAETFMYFVIEDKPTENTIRDEKINFMYEFNELVELRDFIRNNIKTAK